MVVLLLKMIMMEFLSLFESAPWLRTTFIIKLEDLLSSDRVELEINNQWMTQLFGYHKDFYSTLHLNMKANN